LQDLRPTARVDDADPTDRPKATDADQTETDAPEPGAAPTDDVASEAEMEPTTPTASPRGSWMRVLRPPRPIPPGPYSRPSPADEANQRRDVAPHRTGERRRSRRVQRPGQRLPDQLFALVARMVPDRDQASDVVQEAFFSGVPQSRQLPPAGERQELGSPHRREWRDGLQRARRRRPVQPIQSSRMRPGQPPAGPSADPKRTPSRPHERSRVLNTALAKDRRRPAFRDRPVRPWRATTTPRSPT